MARRRIAKKRDVPPDPVYNSKLVSKLINRLMRDGKKSKAERICYECFDIIRKRSKKDPLEVFLKALENVKPILEVRPRRVGGATYQVPVEVRKERQEALAYRWIIQFARERKGKPMAEKLAEEIMMASRGEGPAVKKKEDTHRMAEANRAFAHYRW
ncbi:30S ribosomal protein S7 [Candidatus Aerophobetes bacterium]|uniref:Small ribosomal subunit protein uS7 n=1 Tax=Aerophobetes bacterium TaxID=2030807 RepID=A0A497E5N6_UNCAE|nr:30S ribosomal protein S7 [Candidatus Aerophobetes bacterium]RLE10526.1 MAG: 30S ribosomal protein S7 [Candidatus Aerophobetes bacterium]